MYIDGFNDSENCFQKQVQIHYLLIQNYYKFVQDEDDYVDLINLAILHESLWETTRMARGTIDKYYPKYDEYIKYFPCIHFHAFPIFIGKKYNYKNVTCHALVVYDPLFGLANELDDIHLCGISSQSISLDF